MNIEEGLNSVSPERPLGHFTDQKLQEDLEKLDLNVIELQQGTLKNKDQLIAGYEELKQPILDELEYRKNLASTHPT